MPGHSAPSAGFDAPLQMMSACHQRLHQQNATLIRLVGHLAQHGADADARSAAAAVMRYFDTAAVHHHADEEADLFPALLEAMAGSDAVCLRELTESLKDEHRELETCWARVRDVLQHVAAGRNAVLDAAHVAALVDGYQRHIEREDNELLPMAERLLDDAALARIGGAMRARRGIAAGD